MSGDFVSHLSESNAKLCRRIDSVFLVGKAERTSLFTWDFWTGSNLSQNHVLSPLSQLLVDENSTCTAYEYCAKVRALFRFLNFVCEIAHFFEAELNHFFIWYLYDLIPERHLYSDSYLILYFLRATVRGGRAVVRGWGLDRGHQPALRVPADLEGRQTGAQPHQRHEPLQLPRSCGLGGQPTPHRKVGRWPLDAHMLHSGHSQKGAFATGIVRL